VKRIAVRTLIFAAVLACTSARSFAENAPAAQQPAVNALWVYSVTSLPDPVTESPTRSTLVQNGWRAASTCFT
jgi:hypothetical protein